MSRVTPSMDGDDPFPSPRSRAVDDVVAVRDVLVAAARDRRVLTYSEALASMGHRFTRPKMRILVRTMGEVDEAGRKAGEPGLAALVVRASDGLPGEGWWNHHSCRLGHASERTGPDAVRFVEDRQTLAFDHWAGTAP